MGNNETQQKDIPECQYNQGVVCDPNKRNCDVCGWNPAVAMARLIRICSKNRVQIPSKKEKKA